MLVELNNTTHHAAVILKTVMPKRVGEHDIRSAVRAMLIGAVEEAAQIRLNAQYVEVVPAPFHQPDMGWIVAGVQSCVTDVVSGQTVKAAVAIAQVQIVGVR